MLKRVLMIDDDLEMCREMEEILTDSGYEVRLAHNGKTGLTAALAGSFDVILLDFKMPDLTGLEVLTELRKTKPDEKVILLSGRPFISHLEHDPTHTETNIRLIKMANAIINKPFDIAKVLSKIEELAGRD